MKFIYKMLFIFFKYLSHFDGCEASTQFNWDLRLMTFDTNAWCEKSTKKY